MIFAGILAGGSGTRMKITDMPKQFLMLGSKPIIIHSIEKFLLTSRIDVIYLGVNKEWLEYCYKLINQYIKEDCYRNKIKIISGGKDRTTTLMNIVYDIEKNYKNSEENIILTHDAVRPFVSLRIIEENIEMALKYDACGTAIPCTDTIVESIDNTIISNIPNRNILYRGQSPQTFKLSLLKTLYEQLEDDEREILTDACKMCVLKNKKAYLVQGDPINFKITTMSDYNIAKAIVNQEENI